MIQLYHCSHLKYIENSLFRFQINCKSRLYVETWSELVENLREMEKKQMGKIIYSIFLFMMILQLSSAASQSQSDQVCNLFFQDSPPKKGKKKKKNLQIENFFSSILSIYCGFLFHGFDVLAV